MGPASEWLRHALLTDIRRRRRMTQERDEKPRAASVPLELAMMCLDCAEVFEVDIACPKCGSQVMHSVARWLNRRT